MLTSSLDTQQGLGRIHLPRAGSRDGDVAFGHGRALSSIPGEPTALGDLGGHVGPQCRGQTN